MAEFRWLKHYPLEIDWSKNYTPKPLYSILDNAVSSKPRNTCTNFFGKKLSYSEVHNSVNRVAAGLEKRGVGPGVNIGLLLPNCPSFIIYYYAIMKLGATVVNYNPLYSHEELRFQIKNSNTKILVTLDLSELFDKVEALIAKNCLQEAIICSFTKLLPTSKSILFGLFQGSQLSKPDKSSVKNNLVLESELINNDGVFTQPEIRPEHDIAVLQYSGGTTGVPKAAMLSHANLFINTQQVVDWAIQYKTPNQRLLAILPFFHVFGMTVVMNYAISVNAEIILMPRFEVDETLRLIQENKITIMPGVPTLFNAIIHHPKLNLYDLTSLQFCFSGGAALPQEIKQKFESLTKCKLIEGYGLSEASPVVTANPLNGPVKKNSIGQPLQQTIISLRSLDDPRKEVPIGEKGEICILGPQVMKGYWQTSDSKSDIFVGKYLRTGDVAIMDEEGFIFIVDRIKDLIICSGYNIYPRRIEEALLDHPEVQEAAVIGIKDKYKGELPKAFVKLCHAALATEQDLIAHLKPKLSKLEIPAEIEFRNELPKTLIGKLSKKDLRLQTENAL